MLLRQACVNCLRSLELRSHLVEVQLQVLAETRAVVIAFRLGVAERFEQRVGLSQQQESWYVIAIDRNSQNSQVF